MNYGRIDLNGNADALARNESEKRHQFKAGIAPAKNKKRSKTMRTAEEVLTILNGMTAEQIAFVADLLEGEESDYSAAIFAIDRKNRPEVYS